MFIVHIVELLPAGTVIYLPTILLFGLVKISWLSWKKETDGTRRTTQNAERSLRSSITNPKRTVFITYQHGLLECTATLLTPSHKSGTLSGQVSAQIVRCLSFVCSTTDCTYGSFCYCFTRSCIRDGYWGLEGIQAFLYGDIISGGFTSYSAMGDIFCSASTNEIFHRN